MSKYKIETQYMGKWIEILRDSRAFCQGYFMAVKDCQAGPHNAWRLTDPTGKVVDEIAANASVNIGMVAGFPTSRQFVSAAFEALQSAKWIDEMDDAKEARRGGTEL